MQPVGVVFKGSGWYINDSRTTSKSGNGSSDKGETVAKPSSDVATESGASKKSDSATPAAAKDPAKSTAKSAD